MEHTFTDPEDGVSYTVTPQSPRVLQGIGAPLAREVLRLVKELSAVAVDRDRIGAETRAAAKVAEAAAERERKLREALLALVLACDHNVGDYDEALVNARALLKEDK